MRSKLRKGEIAEALFVAKVLSLGMNVSKPFGQNCRYDFMVEVMGRATRVQVKSTWQKKDVSRFAFPISRKRVASRRSQVGSQSKEEDSPQRTRRYTKKEEAGPSTRAATRPTEGREEKQSRPSLGMTNEYVVRAGGTTTRGARRYRESEVDYIAAFVGPEDEWYVIPVGKIPSAFTIVLPGRYARYKEAWDQLCPRGTYVGDIRACVDPKVASSWSLVAGEEGTAEEIFKSEIHNFKSAIDSLRVSVVNPCRP